MSKYRISELFLYKYRFYIGYGLVALGLILALILAGLYLPGGLSDQEMQSVVVSESIKMSDTSSFAITNMPYHLMQKLSIVLFGVTILSVKLPSIILAFLAAVGMVIILKRWFKLRIGVLASIIAITTGQFMFIAQDGTPGIMYLFLSVWLILIADLISRQEKYRTLLIAVFSMLGVISLYTPLSIYIIMAVFAATLLHPHLRYVAKHISRLKILSGVLIAIILIIPLVYMIIKSPSLGLSLLGIPTTWPDLTANFDTLTAQYLSFNHPGGTTIMTPFFELGTAIIIAFGAFHIWQTRFSSKSYVMIIWVLSLIPFILINPDLTTITYLPLVILMAAGLSKLIASWYILFPFNPYARFGGLVPIVVLVSALVLSGVDRYVHGYIYSPGIASNFSNDLRLIPKNVNNIIVSDQEKAFYETVSKHSRNNLTIIDEATGDMFIATRLARKDFSGYSIDKIITSSRSQDSDRFYLYKKIAE